MELQFLGPQNFPYGQCILSSMNYLQIAGMHIGIHTHTPVCLQHTLHVKHMQKICWGDHT